LNNRYSYYEESGEDGHSVYCNVVRYEFILSNKKYFVNGGLTPPLTDKTAFVTASLQIPDEPKEMLFVV